VESGVHVQTTCMHLESHALGKQTVGRAAPLSPRVYPMVATYGCQINESKWIRWLKDDDFIAKILSIWSHNKYDIIRVDISFSFKQTIQGSGAEHGFGLI
jgi:hypothetical protein